MRRQGGKEYEADLAYELELMREADRASILSEGCQCGLFYTDTGNYLLGQKAQKCRECGKLQLRLGFLGDDGFRILSAEGKDGRYALVFFKTWEECRAAS
jgi:hypothetical protein